MSPQPWICFTLVLTGFTLSRIKASPGTFDYMVDCSACQSTPVTNIQSYTCAVRCDVEESAKMNLTGFVDVLNGLVQKLEDTTEVLQETRKELAETRKELEKLRQKTLGDDVYFAVQLDTNMNIASGQILPFRTIKSNVGNGYDINTFKFKPPYNGTYEFMLQIMAWHSSSSKAEITANGLDQCRAHTGPDQYSTGVCRTVLKLSETDEVYVKNYGPATDGFNYYFTMFNGNIIRREE